MSDPKLALRPGAADDIVALDRLFAKSYPALLAEDYAPNILDAALPRMITAQPALVVCGTYFVAELGDSIVGAGGWTFATPGKGGDVESGVGHVRHFVTDPDHVRCGIGRVIMGRVLDTARDSGVRQLQCYATRTAVPFYRASGFEVVEGIDITFAPGIVFPAVHMLRKEV